jgi:hypothetical protein
VKGGDQNSVVRFDLKFSAGTPTDCPRELWFDHAIVNETSITYADNTLRYLENEDHGDLTDGPAFSKMKNKKAAKYSALVDVAKRLSDDRKLDTQPSFLTPIISSLGYMNSDFDALIKFMVERFRDTQKLEPERDDGVDAKVLAGRFKVQIRNSLCFALVKGNALAVYNQGLRYMSKPP